MFYNTVTCLAITYTLVCVYYAKIDQQGTLKLLKLLKLTKKSLL